VRYPRADAPLIEARATARRPDLSGTPHAGPRFQKEAWELIRRAPVMAAMAVVAASPSGPIGVVKAMFAVGKVLEEASREDPANELISALVSAVKAGHRPAGATEPRQSLQAVDRHRWSLARPVGR
jgi:hypothetical protein